MTTGQKQVLDFVTLDVFTSTPFSGNPLALVNIPTNLKSYISKIQKQKIATEFNYSETVFVHERGIGPRLKWDVEIFTTTEELPFAGHPTIGAAVYTLKQEYAESATSTSGIETATLVTRSGEITIKVVKDVLPGDNDSFVVQASIPHNVRIHERTFAREEKEPCWSIINEKIRQAERVAPFVSIVKGMTFMMIQLESLEDLASVEVRNDDLMLNVMLDTEDDWNESFVGRYYYVIDQSIDRVNNPRISIRTRMLEKGMEDPATGSAASALASYLALRGIGEKFEVVQGVEMGRRSVICVDVELQQDMKSCRAVKLSGTAVQIMEGKLQL